MGAFAIPLIVVLRLLRGCHSLLVARDMPAASALPAALPSATGHATRRLSSFASLLSGVFMTSSMAVRSFPYANYSYVRYLEVDAVVGRPARFMLEASCMQLQASIQRLCVWCAYAVRRPTQSCAAVSVCCSQPCAAVSTRCSLPCAAAVLQKARDIAVAGLATLTKRWSQSH